MLGWLRAEAARASCTKRGAGPRREALRGQDLDRHLAPEAGVAGAVDLAHAPRSERPHDLVGTEAMPAASLMTAFRGLRRDPPERWVSRFERILLLL